MHCCLAVYAGVTVGSSGPIIFSHVQCSGSEKSLLDCQRTEIAHDQCSHATDASVFCYPEPSE